MPQLTNLTVEYVSLVDRAAVRDPSNPTEPQRFLLTKSEIPIWKAEGGANTDPQGGSMTEEELRAAVQKAEAERDEAKAALAKAEKKLAKKADKSDEGKPEKIDKSALPPEVRAIVEKAEKDQADAEARLAKAESKADEAEKLAKAERDQRIEREFIAKAEADFPHLGDASELGPRLKRMSESLSKEDYDAHLTQLAAANEQIAKGDLFREIGRGGDPSVTEAGGEDAAKLAKAAEEIRKADPSLSAYEAQVRAIRQDREAQARYLDRVR